MMHMVLRALLAKSVTHVYVLAALVCSRVLCGHCSVVDQSPDALRSSSHRRDAHDGRGGLVHRRRFVLRKPFLFFEPP